MKLVMPEIIFTEKWYLTMNRKKQINISGSSSLNKYIHNSPASKRESKVNMSKAILQNYKRPKKCQLDEFKIRNGPTKNSKRSSPPFQTVLLIQRFSEGQTETLIPKMVQKTGRFQLNAPRFMYSHIFKVGMLVLLVKASKNLAAQSVVST